MTEIIKVDKMIKDRYQEIDETIYLGKDKDENVLVKVYGTFEVLSIEWFNTIEDEKLKNQKIVEALNNVFNRIKHERSATIKEIVLENTSEN